MERLSTGIDELDALIQGYPKGKSFLISGDAGTGKTILALHFLNACCKEGLKSIYKILWIYFQIFARKRGCLFYQRGTPRGKEG